MDCNLLEPSHTVGVDYHSRQTGFRRDSCSVVVAVAAAAAADKAAQVPSSSLSSDAETHHTADDIDLPFEKEEELRLH